MVRLLTGDALIASMACPSAGSCAVGGVCLLGLGITSASLVTQPGNPQRGGDAEICSESCPMVGSGAAGGLMG
jgi:hypothetical protein